MNAHKQRKITPVMLTFSANQTCCMRQEDKINGYT